MASFRRRELLERSLHCYEKQDFDNSRFELVVVDDHSEDGTRELVLDWSKRTGIISTVLTTAPKQGEWIDCGAYLNHAIRVSQGEHVILTHPEILVGRRSVATCVEELQKREWLYACCRGYYLSPRDQVRIDTVDWMRDGPLAVRNIEEFYDEGTTGNPDYSHRATDIVAQPGSRLPEWGSWIFGGHSRKTWKTLGGFLPSRMWGSCDVSWNARRRTLGIPNYTCPSDDCIVIHQCHDLPGNVPTPRDMDAWVRELQGTDLTCPSKLVYPHINYLE